jgi:hypothetical protein
MTRSTVGSPHPNHGSRRGVLNVDNKKNYSPGMKHPTPAMNILLRMKWRVVPVRVGMTALWNSSERRMLGLKTIWTQRGDPKSR